VSERTGQQLGNYRLVSLLGQGGYAEVYLGQHVRFNQQAAIKVVHAHLSDQEFEHFRHEAETIATLAHPSIVRVFDFDVQEGVPFLVMEYAPNGSLRRRFPRGSLVPLPQIISLVKQVADALQYAHEQKFIHRDVKPENMLLGRREEVLLSDFGLAAWAHSTASLSTQGIVGTIAYMAPEQIQGHPRVPSDQYALGVVVYEWLCGSRPFEGSVTEMMVQHLMTPPPPLHEKGATISPEVEQVVLRALAKDPKARFASVQDFAVVLEDVCEATRSFSLILPSEDLPREQSSLNATTQVPSLENHERFPSDAQRLSVWSVPYARNPFFTGREEILDRLATALQPGQAAALSQPVAISGLGGIGKTHLAVEYTYRHRQDYQAVFWVRADMRENLMSDFVAMARELHLPVVDTQQTVNAVKAWLRTHGDWLLILDNADDLALAREVLPPQFGGQVLLTTRAQAMGRLAHRIEVDAMPEGVGVLFLLRRAGLIESDTVLAHVSPQEREVARELVQELGGLPLALDQAGAYMEETPCGMQEYLRLYRTRRTALLSRRGGIVDDHPAAVATTWSLAFASVEQANPAAADLLRVCAFLHPDAIPEDLLRQGAMQTEAPFKALATDDLAFHEALRTLGAYSLLRRDRSSRTLSTHRLVQAVLIDAMTTKITQAWIERTTSLVLTALPESFSTGWAVWDRLLPHVLTCSAHILQAQLVSPEAPHFLQFAGNYLRERGLFAEAEPLYQRALQIHEQELGPMHPITVDILNDIGRIYRDKGKYEEAESLLQRALAIREQELGPMHPDTASSLNDLGGIYQSQGKYAEAELLYQRAQAIYEQALGPMHSATAGILSNLGGLYRNTGKYGEAEPLLQRALAICEQQLGPMHSATAVTLQNLGGLYGEQGKYEEAEPLLQRALAIYEQERGPMHPATAGILENLGRLYQAQGRLTEAEEVLQRSLTIVEELQDTRQMAMVLHNLGNVYQAQGKHVEAEALFQRTLAMREEGLGPIHPEIAGILTNLGNVYQAQGKLMQAEEVLQRSLTIGEDLGDTRGMAIALYNLGNVYQAQGMLTEAREVLQRALVICEQQVGLDLEQAHLQMIREQCEAFLEKLARSTEVSGHMPEEFHHNK